MTLKVFSLIITLFAVQSTGCSQLAVYSVMQNIERKQCLEAGQSPSDCIKRTANVNPTREQTPTENITLNNSDPLTHEIERAVAVSGSQPINPTRVD